MRRFRGKKFTPQIPRKELLDKTTEELKRCGVDHHSQAVLMNEIGKLVLSSDNPLFIPIHPKPQNRNDEAWIRSYAIVFSILKERKMDLTRDILSSEANFQIPSNVDFLKKESTYKFLSNLTRKHIRIGFNKRVRAYAEGKQPTRPSYDLPEKIKPVIPKMSMKKKDSTL